MIVNFNNLFLLIGLKVLYSLWYFLGQYDDQFKYVSISFLVEILMVISLW